MFSNIALAEQPRSEVTRYGANPRVTYVGAYTSTPDATPTPGPRGRPISVTPGSETPTTSSGGSTRTIGGGGVETRSPGDPSNPPSSTTPSNANGNGSAQNGTTDPIEQALLDTLMQGNLGGGYVGGAYPSDPMLSPGLQGTGNVTTTQSSSPAFMIIILAILAVGGYYLWTKYKGKLKKHEGA